MSLREISPGPLSCSDLRVFVYGTLRFGQKNFFRFLGGKALKILPATIEGRLYFVKDGGYPYLLPGRGKVFGDLVFIDPKQAESTLRELDALEEYDPNNETGSVYLRRPAFVELTSGKRIEAWTYYWNCPGITGVWVKSGDFADCDEALKGENLPG